MRLADAILAIILDDRSRTWLERGGETDEQVQRLAWLFVNVRIELRENVWICFFWNSDLLKF